MTAAAVASADGAAGGTPSASERHGVFRPRVFLVSPAAMAGLKPGDSLLAAPRAWGFPAEVARVRRMYRGAVYADQVLYWSNAPNAGQFPVWVEARHGKVAAIQIVLDRTGPTSRVRTTRGDRLGSSEASIRAHWPRARRVKSCCSSVVWYVLPGSKRNSVFAFRLVPLRPRSLDAFFLGSQAAFACEIGECHPS